MNKRVHNSRTASRSRGIAAAAAALLCAALLFFAVKDLAIPYAAYRSAQRAASLGNYTEALGTYKSLGAFLSSESEADACRLELAGKALDAGDYGTAGRYADELADRESAACADFLARVRARAGALLAAQDEAAAWQCYAVAQDEAGQQQAAAALYERLVAEFAQTGVVPADMSLPLLAGYRDADRYVLYGTLQKSDWDDAATRAANVRACYELGDFLNTAASGFLPQRLYGRTYANSDGYYFKTDANGDWKYNLPAYRYSGYYGLYSRFEGSTMSIGSDEKDAWTKQFRFSLADDDRTLSVYSYAGGYTVTLTLQDG